MIAAGLDPNEVKLDVINARMSKHNEEFSDYLYGRLQRQGYLKRDVLRLINQDRNTFAACMVALGYADGMVTGVTRNFDQALDEVQRAIDPAPGGKVMGMSIVLAKGQTLFIADTNVTEMPGADDLVAIACEAARSVRRLGFTPRLAFLSYSAFVIRRFLKTSSSFANRSAILPRPVAEFAPGAAAAVALERGRVPDTARAGPARPPEPIVVSSTILSSIR